MDPEFFQHSYHRTYYWAGLVAAVLDDPLAYAEDLQPIFDGGGVLALVERFDRQSVLHKFTEFWIDHSFYNDASPRRLVRAPGFKPAIDRHEEDWVLSVESALLELGVGYGPRTCDALRSAGRYSLDHATGVDDFYFEWFQELRLSQPYEDLVRRLSDEVFFVLFLNRTLLASLNGLVAECLQALGLGPGERRGDVYGRPDGSVAVERAEVPVWAQQAVRFRDRNRCINCGLDMSENWGRPEPEHFDHIIPLSKGGLNDVTNLQLLHRKCNLSKGARLRRVNEMHQRWYPRSGQ